MEKIKFNGILFYKIKDFNDYYVSKCGKVLSTKRYKNGKLLKRSKNHYYFYKLSRNNKRYTKTMHRLIAEKFIPNPNNKPEINHKDLNKFNNNINNLEWVTRKENDSHARKFLSHNFGRKVKKIEQMDLEGNTIKIWDSANQIEKELGYNQSAIRACCKGLVKKSYGYIWWFEDWYKG